MSDKKLTIAVDFDGVLHNFDKGFYDGTCYGEPIEGSIDTLKILSKKYNVPEDVASEVLSFRKLQDNDNQYQIFYDLCHGLDMKQLKFIEKETKILIKEEKEVA